MNKVYSWIFFGGILILLGVFVYLSESLYERLTRPFVPSTPTPNPQVTAPVPPPTEEPAALILTPVQSPTPTTVPTNTPATTPLPTPTIVPTISTAPTPQTLSIAPVEGFTPPDNYQVYTLRSEFVLYTDLPKEEARAWLRFMGAFRDYFNKNFLNLSSTSYSVYLFKDSTNYPDWQKCETRLGCYWQKPRLFVLRPSSGLGTSAHLLTHAFMDDTLSDKKWPVWLGEGLPALFESFMGHFTQGEGLNIRLGIPNPQRLITDFETDLKLRAILNGQGTPTQEHLAVVYLYRRGWLRGYLTEFKDVASKDSAETGAELDSFGVLLDLISVEEDKLEEDWKFWRDSLSNVSKDKDESFWLYKVPPSFVLENQTIWQRWWELNKNDYPIFEYINPRGL